jgi:hypothetical protein
MSEIMPALIGLLGVVVGGIIQVIFQIRQSRGQQAVAIRREVGEFAAATSNYLNTLDSATHYMSRPHPAGPSKDRMGEEADVVEEKRHDLLVRGSMLVTAGDWRISDQASKVVNQVNELASTLSNVFTEPSPSHRNTFLNGAAGIRTEFNILLAMVAPTVLERHFRFRSAEQAGRFLDASARRRGK